MRMRLKENEAGEHYEPEGLLCMQSSLREPEPQEKGLGLQLIPLGVSFLL